MKITVLAGLLVVASLSVASAGCSVTSEDPGGQATSDAAVGLPDEVPLLRGMRVVGPVEPITGSTASGWTAVAVIENREADPSVTNADLATALSRSGWSTQSGGSIADGLLITGTRRNGSSTAWLNINVSAPLPGSGPVVTYRYATGPGFEATVGQ